MRNRRGDNIVLKIVVEIVACCWNCVQAWVEFLTRMSVIGLAITGANVCVRLCATVCDCLCVIL